MSSGLGAMDKPTASPQAEFDMFGQTVDDKGNRPAMTPVMEQYFRIKAEHQDDLVFFHLGDFYEIFFDDAIKAAKALDIALTKRGRHQGQDIPMCGVPIHSADSYLARLVEKGFRVIVVDQVDTVVDGGVKGGRGLMERQVSRIVTSGTLTEDSLLQGRENNYLASITVVKGLFSLAWIDISTGDFLVQSYSQEPDIMSALTRIEAREILVDDRLRNRDTWRDPEVRSKVQFLPAARFDPTNGRRRLEEFYAVKSLDIFAPFDRGCLASAGLLLDYIKITQTGHMPRIAPLRLACDESILRLDGATIRNLEILHPLSPGGSPSLIKTIDTSQTGGGGRLLRQRLRAPSTDLEQIKRYQDRAQFFIDHGALCQDMRDRLAVFPDPERCLARLSVGRGGPRDLLAIRTGLEIAAAIGVGDSRLSQLDLCQTMMTVIPRTETLRQTLDKALDDEAPILARDGGFIKADFAHNLDEIRRYRDEGRRQMKMLEQRYIQQTGIAKLRIKSNKIIGWYIEVNAVQAASMPMVPEGPFIHRQSMAGSVRFVSQELNKLYSDTIGAGAKAVDIEMDIFDKLSAEVLAAAKDIVFLCRSIAQIDVAIATAHLAISHHYCRPAVDDGTDFIIEGGRHPLVEEALKMTDKDFVANDCSLGVEANIWLLTGPNMAGKSTFLRQNAVISIMAQAGLWVPATKVNIGWIDQIFSRVGASDDLARGRSTFMVEMSETATILHRATKRSFVILDEVGRGTATFDGLSLAWAVVEYLAQVNRCRTLFATHYHELTSLDDSLNGLALRSMKIKKWRDEIIFLHEVVAGASAGSYGLHVAALAGIPDRALTRAKQILSILEQSERGGELAEAAKESSIFSDRPSDIRRNEATQELIGTLRRIDIDSLSPKAALDQLYQLRQQLVDIDDEPIDEGVS